MKIAPVLMIALVAVSPWIAGCQRLEASSDVAFLEQGWSKETRELYYYTPQGSRMIPLAWFMALETADGQGLFAESANLERYGFLPADSRHALNPLGLPIGFATDPESEPGRGQMLGLSCAACHTGEVTVEGKRVRIDGGAGNLDFDSFYADLAQAVKVTFFDEAAFGRFARRVLDEPTPETSQRLRAQLAAFQATIAGQANLRRPTLASGFGRVDALTQIVNALAVTGESDARNFRAPGAPTSYPSVWLAPELEFVQWSPIAASPIGRNGGEVLGVFGSIDLTGEPADWFTSSLLIPELNALELWIADLKPPPWNETLFGPIDRELAKTGGALFRDHCAACHNMPPYRRTDPAQNAFGKTFIAIGRVNYRKIGTDPLYSEALLQRLVHTNRATRGVSGGQPVAPAALFFLGTVGAAVERAMDDAGLDAETKLALHGHRFRPAADGGTPEPYTPTRQDIASLKAGPLAGIWASGPYLHNGSVPTVEELLSPVEERRKVFWTGGRELDRQRLGFVSGNAPGRFRFDTGLPGNRNTGHLYPKAGLTADERKAVIEYLKTL